MTRRKSSPAEDFIDLVALLPWWAGVGLAAISYVLLHKIAAQPIDALIKSEEMSAMMTQGLWRGFANFGQYLVPMLCIAGAGASAWKRKVRRKLLDEATKGEGGDAVDGMNWREFEMLVGEGFRLQGYKVVETGGGGADGGVDLVLSKPGGNGDEKFLVQCKQWRAYKVGVDVVRELYGVMAARGAAGGFLVTSGRFTSEATAFASGRNVTLIDGPNLRGLLQRARAGGGADTSRALAARSTAGIRMSFAESPICPTCSKPMIRRTAKRGSNAGGEFWGCTGYPACRRTRAIG